MSGRKVFHGLKKNISIQKIKYGNGDWRNISRNFVVTRTPTQVASHAQKYFIRLNSGGKDKRASIHDITTVSIEDNRSPSPPQPSVVTIQSSRPPLNARRSNSPLIRSRQTKATSYYHQSPYGILPYHPHLINGFVVGHNGLLF